MLSFKISVPFLILFLLPNPSFLASTTGVSNSPCLLNTARALSLIGWFRMRMANGLDGRWAERKNWIGSHSISVIMKLLGGDRREEGPNISKGTNKRYGPLYYQHAQRPNTGTYKLNTKCSLSTKNHFSPQKFFCSHLSLSS